MSARAILALDQGTTGSAALVFDGEGRVLASADREIAQGYPEPGHVEHNADEILATTVAVGREAIERSGLAARDIRAIGITNQRETTVVWDRATSRPIAPAVVWQSRASAGVCERLKAGGLGPLVRERTGLVIDAYFSGTKIRWLLDRIPGAQERAAAGELCFGTVDSWLIWKLSGGSAHLTDRTNASRTLLYDIREGGRRDEHSPPPEHGRRLETGRQETGRRDDPDRRAAGGWDAELLAALEVPAAMLPEVRSSSELFCETDAFGAAIPITGVAGDQQAALFGQTCTEAGEAKNTYGTGCFLLANTGTALARGEGLLSTIGISTPGTLAYALEGSAFVTGAAVQWLRDGLGIIRDAAETDALASSLSGNGGLYLVPAFAGLGAPHWDMYARGALLGITGATGRAHVVRATLESIAYQTRDLVDAMAGAGQPVAVLRVDGGGTANRFLMQFQADLLGVPVEVARIGETTALGAAYLAGLAAGVWRDVGELRAKRAVGERYEPRMSADERDTLYAAWRRAVERAKGWAR